MKMETDFQGDNKKMAVELADFSIVYKGNKKRFHRLQGLLKGRNVIDDNNKLKVKNVKFQLTEGEKLGITGVSGGGKSLLIKGMLGMLDPEIWEVQGTCEFFGKYNFNKGSVDQRRKVLATEISYIPQDSLNSLNPYMGVLDQLTKEVIHARGLSWDEAEKTAIRWLEKMKIYGDKSKLNSLPGAFSGGMRQRVIFAMAMVKEPRLLIADEPSSALDVINQLNTVNILKELMKNQDLTLMYVSHSPGMIGKICDKIAIVDDGCLKEYSSVENFFQKPVSKEGAALLEASKKLTEGTLRKEKVIILDRGCESVITPDRGQKSVITADQCSNCEIVMELSNITKIYGKHKVLDDLDLNLEKAKALGVVGGSGSGKSTLAQLAVGLQKPTEGTVKLNGRNLPLINDKKRNIEEYPVQMIFQNSAKAFNPKFSVGQSMIDTAKRFMVENPNGAIEKYMKKCHLDQSLLKRLPSQLSGGQLQRMAICRAMLSKPKVLVADEIISALDITVQLEIMELLQELLDEGHMSLVFITHDLNAVRQIADKTIVLDEGKLVFYGDTEELWQCENKAVTKLRQASDILAI